MCVCVCATKRERERVCVSTIMMPQHCPFINFNSDFCKLLRASCTFSQFLINNLLLSLKSRARINFLNYNIHLFCIIFKEQRKRKNTQNAFQFKSMFTEKIVS